MFSNWKNGWFKGSCDLASSKDDSTNRKTSEWLLAVEKMYPLNFPVQWSKRLKPSHRCFCARHLATRKDVASNTIASIQTDLETFFKCINITWIFVIVLDIRRRYVIQWQDERNRREKGRTGRRRENQALKYYIEIEGGKHSCRKITSR